MNKDGLDWQTDQKLQSKIMKNEVSHQGPINIQQQYKLASLTSTCSLLKNLSHFISCGWQHAAYILCLCNLIIFRCYMVIHVSCWKLFECLTLCFVLHIKTEYTLHNFHSVLLSCFHRLQKSCCDLQSSLLMKVYWTVVFQWSLNSKSKSDSPENKLF